MPKRLLLVPLGVLSLLLATRYESAEAQFTGIQMPVAGNVTIEYDSAYSLSFPIPSASHIVVRIANRTKPDTSVTGRLRQQLTGSELWCPCTGPGSAGCDPRTAYRYKRDTSHPPAEWKFTVGSVLPNEQVQLACSTLAPNGQAIGLGFSGTGGPDTVGQTLVWRGYFETDQFWHCHPAYKFIQRVYITLVLSPDTVVRFGSLDSNNVYPYYPAIRNNTVTAGRFKCFVDLEAKIAYGDSILRNYSIRVEKPVVVDSGGHSHNSTRPLGTYRIPKVTGTGFDTVSTFFIRKTDSAGVLKFKFLASQFGGGERIKARTVSDTTKFDTLSIITIVKGLDSLATSPYYLKVGASGDWDPCDTSPPTSLHYGNHYAIPTLRAAIDSIASRYFTAHASVRLRVNDISLIYGGMFDFENHWAANHTEHREGKHADIAYDKGINPQKDCPSIFKDDLRKLIRDFTTGKIFEHPISNPHFHIRMK